MTRIGWTIERGNVMRLDSPTSEAIRRGDAKAMVAVLADVEAMGQTLPIRCVRFADGVICAGELPS